MFIPYCFFVSMWSTVFPVFFNVSSNSSNPLSEVTTTVFASTSITTSSTPIFPSTLLAAPAHPSHVIPILNVCTELMVTESQIIQLPTPDVNRKLYDTVPEIGVLVTSVIISTFTLKMFGQVLTLLVPTLFISVFGSGPPGFNETCVENTYPPSKNNSVPWYTINLDLPGSQRWVQLTADKKVEIKALVKEFLAFAESWSTKNATGKIVDYVVKEAANLDDTIPQPYADELRGIANATGLPLGEVVIYNLFYELFTVCTSIVAQDPNGKLYHARNLDFGLFLGWNTKTHQWMVTDLLRPLIVNLDFQKGGKTVYKSVNFAGYVGILTAIKPKLFTLSMNERFKLDGGEIGIIEWILGIRTGKWMGFLTRETMENAGSFDQAMSMLSNTEMLAPAYFILGGNTTGQGAVITRSREKTDDVWNMKDAGGWYILETNYDHWDAPLFLDDRRTPANNCMQKMKHENVKLPRIFDVLSSRPVLNKLTTYTALMQVDEGHLESWLQYCPDPCWPF